jgi:hypothetical protein
VADEADLAVEALEAAVGEAEADGGEDAVAVGAQGAGQGDERGEPGSGCPGQPGVEVRGRQRGAVEVVEQPELFAQQEGAVEALVGVLDVAEGGELSDGLALGRLEQRPAGVLDPSGRSRCVSDRARSTRRGGPGRSRATRAGRSPNLAPVCPRRAPEAGRFCERYRCAIGTGGARRLLLPFPRAS